MNVLLEKNRPYLPKEALITLLPNGPVQQSTMWSSTNLPQSSTTRTAVFDLDGTMVDSALDLVPSLNRTIAREGLSPISYKQVNEIVGQGGRAMIQRAFQLNDVSADDALLDELLPYFFADYEKHISDNTTFFDGCLSALDALAQDGWRLAVCSNKHEKLAKTLLSDLGELQRFAAITGGDTFDVKKPDPGHVIKTIDVAGGIQENSIMIGDSISDVEAAQAAKIPVIAVDFGYTDIPVSELNPSAIISHFDDLVEAINSITADDLELQKGISA